MPLLKRPLSRARSIPLLLTIGAATLLMAPSAASALPGPVLLATTGGTGGHGTSPPSNLYRLDPATGATTSLGGTGYAITGLAQDPTTGVLYGVSSQGSPIAPLELLTLNPTTGAATPVGPLGEQRVADISFDSQGRLFGWSEFGDELVSIDKGSGAATIVGPSGINTAGSGSSFDRNDTYWLMGFKEGGAFYTVDTATGVPTARGTLTPIDENDSPVSAAAWDCARTTLYATLNNQGEPPANLVTIDTTTGALVNRGLTVTAADGLEWYCPLGFDFGTRHPRSKWARKRPA